MPLVAHSSECSGDGCETPDLSVIWILLCSFLIMSMQLGFAMLEVGSVREAHRLTVLAKNILDSALATIAFAAYNEWHPNDLTHGKDGFPLHHLLIFHSAFCATSVTITSGAMAERTHMLAYLGHAVVMAGVIYPTVARGVWCRDGVLSPQFNGRFHSGFHFHDFAGGGVVHFVGGSAALAGNILLGRRIMQPQTLEVMPGAFESNFKQHPDTLDTQDLEEMTAEQLPLKPQGGWPRRFDSPHADQVEFQGIAYLQVMGMFVLWVGWYAFNSGSTLSMQGSDDKLAALLAWNTSMAAVGGCCGAFVFCMLFRSQLEVNLLVNGTVSGLVAITSCCDVATSRSSLCIGGVAGLFVHPSTCWLIKQLHLDDPVDAISVHWGAGLLGLISGALCKPDCQYFTQILGDHRQEQLRFCTDDWDMSRQLLAQVWGSLIIFCWTVGISGMMWSFFALSECIRSLEVEHIEKAIHLLGELAAPHAVEETQAQFKAVVSRSTIVRKILRKHGWTPVGWQAGMPQSLWALRRKLQVAQSQCAETALENKIARIFLPLASLLHRCALVREVAFLRLRISPAHELSGLGAASADGGKIALVIQRAVLHINRKNNQNMVHSPLRREVQELSMAVQSQEVLLQALTRSGRFRSGVAQWREKRRSLQSVKELQDQHPSSQGNSGEEAGPTDEPQIVVYPSVRESTSDLSSGSISDLRPVADQPQSIDDLGRLLLRSMPPNFPRSVSSQSTDRTVSDGSAGILSPSSNLADTPPPSMIGRGSQSRRSRRRSYAGSSAGDIGSDVAAQLMTVLEAQQQLWMTLQSATPTSVSVGSRTPDTPQQRVQHQAPELHRLQAALQLLPPASTHRAVPQMTTRAI